MENNNQAILSIISNFGCDTGCKYCIWKGHSLSGVKTTIDNTDWTELYRQVSLHKGLISVSGGGDPLFQHEKNNEWWEKLFEMCEALDTKIELHTSKFIPDWEHIAKLERYVLHVELEDAIDNFNKYREMAESIPFRLVIVMNENILLSRMALLSQLCIFFGIELSFRQLVINGETQYIQHEAMIEGHKLGAWHYIQQADYNLYYMPDNKVYTEYQF